MKSPIQILITSMFLLYGSNATAYSGKLWLSQADQAFGTPASMLAHGFLAGVVHSWNSRRETNSPNLCFNASADQMEIKNLMGIVKKYIEERSPDLQAPAQGVIRVAMMGRFPCKADL
jgi:hypothetical protein